MDMLAYASVEFNKIGTLAKIFTIPSIQNQSIRENIFNDARVRRIAFPMNTHFAFTKSYTGNPFEYQQFDL